MVAATQWFGKNFGRFANKKINDSSNVLAVDAILLIWNNIMNGIVVYEKQNS